MLFNLIILYSCSRGQVEEITRLFLEAKKRYDDVDATMKSLISLHKVMQNFNPLEASTHCNRMLIVV